MYRQPERAIQSEDRQIVLRHLISVTEMTELVELQREIWGYGEPGADLPYPSRGLFAIAESGGHVAAAYLGTRAVGLSVAWPGMLSDSHQFYLHSQLMGVLQELRHLGLGYHLKLFQREYALERGFDLIRWTFDPLRSANANLNVRKLGAVIQNYLPDYYGGLRSRFNSGMATDRVWAEWYVSSDRVKERLSNPCPLLEMEPPFPLVTDVADEGGVKRLLACRLQCSEENLLMEIPDDFDQISRLAPSAAGEWQSRLREAFQHYLSRGYAVTDVLIVAGPPRRVFYHLSAGRRASVSAGC